MVRMLRARQRIEILKVPGWVALAESALGAGHTVLFFVNFKATIAALKEHFPDAGVIDGDTPNRDEILQRVQTDQLRVCILNSEAGGVAISAHDITGKHPRYSIVSPGVKAKSFRQVLGRTRRNGSKTIPHISIPVVAGTCEEKIKRKVDSRLDCIDTLCDGLLDDRTP